LALFHYVCPSCSLQVKKLAKVAPELSCPKCNIALERQAQGPGVKLAIVLDNGLQSRTLEVLQHGQEINAERSNIRNDPRVKAAKPHLLKDDE
jgi:hypothetical protein